MTIKDFQAFAKVSWNKYKCSVSELSENKDIHKPLVSSDYEYYNFDKITEDLYNPKRLVSSVDGLEITDKSINFIEFKSGFGKIVTKDNYDESKALCPQYMTENPVYCKSIKNIYLKSEGYFFEKLVDNIKLKAIESINTLEHKIYPNFNDKDTKNIKRNLIVVLDVNSLDGYEDILEGLSNRPSNSKTIGKVRNSLLRFKNMEGVLDFYYDDITVLSAYQYKEQLKLK